MLCLQAFSALAKEEKSFTPLNNTTVPAPKAELEKTTVKEIEVEKKEEKTH